MPITINGTGSITGISAGGLPDDCIVTDDIAAGAVTDAKITGAITDAKLSGTTCKAWVNFNGTSTVAIRASYNVSSITDNGTGDYTVNFTTALADENYAVAGAARGYNAAGTANMRVVSINSASGALASSGVRINTSYANGSNEDIVAICVAIFR